MEDTNKDFNEHGKHKKDTGIRKLQRGLRREFNRFKIFLKLNMRDLNSVTGITIAGIVIIVTVLNIVIPDKEFSDKENRMLAQFPDLSWTAIREGTFTSDVESYVSDQFVARNMWIKLRSGAEYLLGKYNSNGVYKGSDGYLFEDITIPDENTLGETLDAVNDFALYESGRGISTSMLLAPNAANVLSEYLPKYAPVSDQNEYIDKVFSSLESTCLIIDVRDALKAGKDRQLYYRTDHHWTTYGAYVAFCQSTEVLGLDLSAVDFTRYTLTDKFRGTLSSKSGFSVDEPDTIDAYIPDSDVEYVVSYADSDRKSASVYVPESLKTNDKYTVFFGGNYSKVDIRTTCQNKSKILVIKDSYANCFVPFMIPYYNEIIMIDPRYYNDNIYSLIEEEGITQILFIYNANTFFEADYISEVLQVPVSGE